MSKKKEGEIRLVITYVLLGMAVAVLGVGFLYTICDTIATADNDYNPGSLVAATFFHDIIWTLMVAGILYGFYSLVSYVREIHENQPGEKDSDSD